MSDRPKYAAVAEDYAVSKYASTQDARLAMLDEIANLREVKAELLSALEALVERGTDSPQHIAAERAIARARGQS